MPDIFDEVEEEVRAERFRRLLSRYAGLILLAAVLVVGGIAAWRVRGHYQDRRDQAAAAAYLTALNAAQAPGANAQTALPILLRLAQAGPPGYRSLARLRAAALLAQDGKQQQALELYNALASDAGADPLLRDLATLLWAEHQIDTGDPQLLESRLKPLANSPGPWRSLAERQLALLDLRLNRPEPARDILRRLAVDAAAPSGVRKSAQLLLQQLGG